MLAGKLLETAGGGLLAGKLLATEEDVCRQVNYHKTIKVCYIYFAVYIPF